MTESKNAGLSPALVETVAGLSAGTMATLIVHPLDIVKTRMQVHRSRSSTTSLSSSSAAPAPTALTTVSVMRSLAQTDRPLAALYRGLTPNLLGNATSWASFFFFKSLAERGIRYLRQTGNPLSPADFFAASLAAGAATQVITNPIWVLKTRMLASDASAAGAYPSMWAGAATLFRTEGVGGFYRGLGVGMLAVSHGAVQFAVYDPARRMYFARRRRKEETKSGLEGDQHMGNEATVVLSTVAKLVAGVTTYPLQVLRSRLQHYEADALFGRGVSGVVRTLWREDGVRGFYRGMVPGVVRVLPATWVTFLVYENVKYYLPRWVGTSV
ncbi:mitochondrial carrier domain-containing protein [Echria macrotheca]|uniref:Mitochondrial carrier domain-containing protein n=1 Tax=Echria macrotheca TaxID=438768 RepID=A0AAJ0FAV1_9PEZI|nr:mitochondrial carrier domain-containing protein [Echria macrotheca]